MIEKTGLPRPPEDDKDDTAPEYPGDRSVFGAGTEKIGSDLVKADDNG